MERLRANQLVADRRDQLTRDRRKSGKRRQMSGLPTDPSILSLNLLLSLKYACIILMRSRVPNGLPYLFRVL